MSQPSAQDCINDAVAKLRDTKEFGVNAGKEKVFTVYSEDDLMNKSKLITYPAVGVMYEGTRANTLDKTGQGLAGDCSLAIVLLMDGGSVAGINTQHEGARILTAIRKQFRLKCANSPTMHKWRFVSELPMGNVGNLLVFIQRWETPILLT